MPETNRSWLNEYADVFLFEDPVQDGGEILDLIYIKLYCFTYSFSFTAKATTERKAVTGRKRRKIIRKSRDFDEVSGTFPHLHILNTETLDLSSTFDTLKKFRIVFRLRDFPDREDGFEFLLSKVNEFSITSDDGSSITASLSFEAENASPISQDILDFLKELENLT